MGPNWEQFRSAHVPSQLAPRSVELGMGPIGSNWSNWLKADLAQRHLITTSNSFDPLDVDVMHTDHLVIFKTISINTFKG